jgi:hypothetical protein
MVAALKRLPWPIRGRSSEVPPPSFQEGARLRGRNRQALRLYACRENRDRSTAYLLRFLAWFAFDGRRARPSQRPWKAGTCPRSPKLRARPLFPGMFRVSRHARSNRTKWTFWSSQDSPCRLKGMRRPCSAQAAIRSGSRRNTRSERPGTCTTARAWAPRSHWRRSRSGGSAAG